jgi:T6SS immunity protein Tdi1, C-terminal
MMFARFLQYFSVTLDSGNSHPPDSIRRKVNTDFCECLQALGGKTFSHGLYRVYPWDKLQEQTARASELFTPTEGHILVFGADWLGRQFAIDFRETTSRGPAVKCFSFGVPSSFCTDLGIVDFHNLALVDKADAALAARFYKQWRSTSDSDIAPNQCIGYKVPLFLGGEGVVANLELTDMDVYLSLCTQLYHRVRRLPEGTPIGKVLLED